MGQTRTPKEVDATQVVDATVDEVWSLVGDRSTWPEWSPLGSYEWVSDGSPEPNGVGAVNRYRTGRVTATEEIVEYVPGKRLSYRLLSGMPLRDYRADIDLTPIAGGTQLRFHSTFRPRFVGTGWIYRRALQIFVRRMLAGLAERVGTAAPVTAPDIAPTRS